MSDFRINISTDLNDSLAREKLQQLRAEGEKNPLKLKVDVGDIGKLKEVLEITKQIQSLGKSSKTIGSPINTSQVKSTVSQFKALQNQYNALCICVPNDLAFSDILENVLLKLASNF